LKIGQIIQVVCMLNDEFEFTGGLFYMPRFKSIDYDDDNSRIAYVYANICLFLFNVLKEERAGNSNYRIIAYGLISTCVVCTFTQKRTGISDLILHRKSNKELYLLKQQNLKVHLQA
jgi:hypothetical protein